VEQVINAAESWGMGRKKVKKRGDKKQCSDAAKQQKNHKTKKNKKKSISTKALVTWCAHHGS